MKNSSPVNSPFETALREAIRKTIADAKADGTVSMSVDCLKQAVRSPRTSLNGAPVGTNAAYFYGEMFRRICAEPEFSAFILRA